MEDYLVWHYLIVWPKTLTLWFNLTVFPVFYFSILLHLKTFLAPWKRQTIKMKPGFHLDDFFSVSIINLSSRAIGAILRLMTIIYGLILMPLLFVTGGIVALVWAILIPFSFPFYLTKRKPGEKKKQEWISRRSEATAHQNDIRETAKWFDVTHKDGATPLLLDLDRIKSLPGIGVDWAYGWTAEFDKYAHDLTHNHATFPLLIGREKELGELERVLLKTEANNILVVGEPGVARHQLIETLAHRMKTGQTTPALAHKRVLALDMHSLTSAKPSILEVKGLASEILEEAQRAGNVIVYIDEIDKYLSLGEGRIDLTDVLSKFAQSSVGLIGITTPGAYHKYIESNSTLSKLFEMVEISPPTLETVTSELEISIVPVLEKKYKVTVTYPAVKKTVEDADKYLSSTPFPQKAIELLDQTIVYATTQKKQKIITAAFVDEYLSSKLNMPMGDLGSQESEKLANLENLMHKRIINQEAAVHAVAAALRRSRLNISSGNRPVGTFLFLGPTGVGKTETAKALSAIYFGREEAILRYDMSQYQKEEGLERLIGSIKLGSPGELTSKLLDKPFSLLLLDEIEKADREIFNLFLTLTDEGYISDHLGRKISAKNTIIIATSNAGAEFIRTSVQKGVSSTELQKALLDHVQQEKIFSPEFINRFDATVVFTPLSEGHLREVARLMLESLNLRLKPKEIAVDITPELIRKLAVLGNDPAFGARAMRRVITDKVEDSVAQKLLSGQVKKGEKIRIEI